MSTNNDNHMMIDTSSQRNETAVNHNPLAQNPGQLSIKQLQTQYEKYETSIKLELDKDLPEIFAKLTFDIEEATQGKLTDGQHIQLLFGNFMPKYIKTILTHRYMNYESERQISVTKFINNWMKHRVPALFRHLSKESENIDVIIKEIGLAKELEIIETIFNGDNEIYNYRVSKNTPEIEDKLSKIYEELNGGSDNQSEVAKVKRLNFTSFYIVHNINVFGIFKGFDLLLALVTNQNANGSMFKMCLTVLTILGQVKNFLTHTFWSSGQLYGKAITDACVEFIQKRCTSEDLRTASKKDIMFFPTNIESLLDSIYANSTNEQQIDLVYRVSETIELDIALRCLRIPILEKKLNGFQIIIQQIQKVKNGNKQVSALRQGPIALNLQSMMPKRWLNTERLLEWFEQNKIFDIIFGDSLHSECIKKSYSILEFLYHNGRLQRREFDKMWECATKKHEAYKVGILKALAFVATKAKIDDLKYLFAKLKSIPLAEVDKFCLDLMKAIAKKLTGDDTFIVQPRRNNFAQGPMIGPLLPSNLQRSNSLDKQFKSDTVGAGLQRRGSLPPLLDAPQNGNIMASNDFNANLQSPPMKTLLGRKNAMSGESPPDSFGKQKRNKSSSPTGGKNVQFEEQKEFEMQEMPFNMGGGTGFMNQRVQAGILRRPNNQDLNPLEVPADKEDKKTADEDVSFGDANGGDENGFGGADVFNNSFGNGEQNNFGEPSRLQQQPRQYDIEEEKGVDPFHVASDGDRQTICLNLTIMLQDQTLGLDDPEYRDLARQVLDYYWLLCLESSVSSHDLSFQVHKQAIEDLTHLLLYNYQKSVLYFIGKCVGALSIHQSLMSMQALLHKLIANVSFPLSKQKLLLPKNRQELIAVLDSEINLSNVCLSSYIEFKRLSLQHIFEQMGSQELEQENLETQSSLDNDEDRSNSTAQGNQELRSQPREQESEHISIQDESQDSKNPSIFVSPRLKVEEEFKVPKSIRTQSFKEEANTQMIQKATSHPSVVGGQDLIIQAPDRQLGQIISGSGQLIQNHGGMSNPKIINSQTKRNRSGENQLRQDNGNENLIQQPTQQSNNAVNRDFLNDLVTNEVYHYTYYDELHIRLDFLKFLVGSSPQILKPQQLQILWECLVINAFYERERDQFFNWCTQILKTSLQIPQKQAKTEDEVLMMASESIFNDDCMELLFFETLLKLDFRHITEVMYECFERYFMYINELYGQIVTNSAFESAFEVHETKLIGIEALWEILLCARNTKVYKSATEFLHRLYKKMSPSLIDKLNEIKEDLLMTCMDQIKTGYTQIRQDIGAADPYEVPISHFSQSIEDSKNRIARSISQLCKFIDEFEGLRDKNANGKLGAPDREILIKGNNQIGSSPTPKQITLTRPINTKIGAIREEIAQAVFPKLTAKEISLMHKGKDLNEDLKTLKDLPGVGPNDNQVIFVISKRNQYELDIDTMKEDVVQNDEAINEVVNNLKAFMEDIELPDAVLKLAAKKCNLDINEVMMMVLDEEKVSDLQEEVRRNEEASTNNNIILIEESKEDGVVEDAKINLIISNKAEYFDLLFELLNLGINEITNAAWNLLIQIPVNKTLLNQIRTLSSIQIGGLQNWCYVIDPMNSYKMLYSIQIVNSLISVNNEKLSEAEIQERYEWRLRFLELGGFEHLYNILITADLDDFLGGNTSGLAIKALTYTGAVPNKKKSKVQNSNKRQSQDNGGENAETKKESLEIQNNQAKCLGYLISIIKIFIQAALLTNDEEKLLTLINQSSTSPFRKPKNIKSALQSVPESKLNQILFGQNGQKNVSATASDGDNSSAHTPKFFSSNSSTPQCQTPNPQESAISEKIKQSDIAKQQEALYAPIPDGNKGPESLYTQVDDFPRLVEQINGPIAQNILEKVVNFNGLIAKLLNIIYKAVMFCDSPEVSSLVQNSLDLLLPCIVWKPNLLLKEIYEFENLESLLIRTLMQNSNENVRKSIERTFKIICNEGALIEKPRQFNHDEQMTEVENQRAPEVISKLNVHPKVYILKILLLNLPEITEKSDFCEEFFNLITYLMKQCHSSFKNEDYHSISLSDINPQQLKKHLVLDDGSTFSSISLFQWCIYSLKNRPTYEDRYTQYTDKVLAGYLQLTQSLLEINSELKSLTIKGNFNLVKTIFDFLFLLPSMEEQQSKMKVILEKGNEASGDAHPKCKKKLTRKKAFNLLLTLCQNQEENFVQLLQELYEFHSQIQSSQKVVSYQDFDSEVGMRSAAGFVGLKNFGCTCYMNALIQQLFMISDFRQGVLQSDVSDPDLDNSVLYQLKLIFANLQESEKQYYAPTGFTKAFKFFGEPVNVRQQQDTYEFLSMLFDTLEENLKGTSLQSHLKDTVGGLIGNETRSTEEEFPYVGEREEPFFAIQLDIKNKKNLGEALDLFIKPDHLDGDNKYMCEKYDRKVDATRRSYIKKLRNTVIINLKRFDFDYNTMQRLKLNDFCEFPEKINFKPWTKEGIQEREKQQKKKSKAAAQNNPTDNDSDDKPKIATATYEDGSVHESSESGTILQGDVEMLSASEVQPGHNGLDEEDDILQDEDDLNVLPDTAGKYFDVEDFNDIAEEDESETNRKAKKTHNKNVPLLSKIEEQKQRKEKKGVKAKKQKTVKDESYYEYQLVGVLVHSGSADAGHYYSFIKDRSRSSKNRWLEFNDTYVREFDVKNLGQECFGGEQKSGMPSSGGMLNDFSPADARMFERCRNAYLLFYERVNPIKEDQIQLLTTSSVSKRFINGIESSVYQRIWEENAAFMKLKLFFDSEYFSFARDYIKLYNFENILFFDKENSSTYKYKSLINLTHEFIHEQASNPDIDVPQFRQKFIKDQQTIHNESKNSEESDIFSPGVKSELTLNQRIEREPGLYAIKLATILSQDIILKVKDVQSFVQWLQLMDSLYEKHSVACVWLIKYLTENKQMINELLIETQQFEVREIFAKLLMTALSVTAKNEERYFNETDGILMVTNLDKQEGHELQRMTISRSAVIRFMEQFFSDTMLDKTLRQNWRRFDEYFQVLASFAQIGFSQMKYLVENQNAILKLLEFIMNSLSPFSSNKLRMGDKGQQPNFTQPLELLSILIRSCFTPGIKEQKQYSPESLFQTEDKHLMIPIDYNYFPLFTPECFTNDLLVNAQPQNDSLLKMIVHLCWGDLYVSTFIVNEIMSQIRNRRNIKDLTYQLKILSSLMHLNDDIMHQRLNMIFQFIQPESQQEQQQLSAFSVIDTSSQNLEGASLRKSLFKFLDLLTINYASYVFEILNFFGEQAVIYDQTGQILGYMQQHKDIYQDWVQTFLIQHVYTNNKFTESQAQVEMMNSCIQNYKQIFGEEIQQKMEAQSSNVFFGEKPAGYDSPLGFQQNAPSNFEDGVQGGTQNVKNIDLDDFAVKKEDPFGDNFD